MSRVWLFALVCLSTFPPRPSVAAPPDLDAAPLTWEGDLSARMLDGAYRFIERQIAESIVARQHLWRRDLSGRDAYDKSVAENRRRFRRQIGVVDERSPPAMERYGDDRNPALVAETPRYRVYQVRWIVLTGPSAETLWADGLLLEPRAKSVGLTVALPDADQSPEQLVGLAPGIPPEQQFARRLAERGLTVIAPLLIDRGHEFTGNPVSGRSNPGYSHREWIYRQAYHMGRHVIGYEVQKILAAVDWFEQSHAGLPVGVAGYGEGGLLALYAAAADTRLAAALVSGYFNSRQNVAGEPLYRNVWALLHEFGDAEIATLVAPRGLVIEHSAVPEVIDRQIATPPQVNGFPLDGIHGRIVTPAGDVAKQEYDRIESLAPASFQPRDFVAGPNLAPIGPGSEPALSKLLEMLSVKPLGETGEIPQDRRASLDTAARMRRQVKDLENFIQALVADSHLARDKHFSADLSSAEAFATAAQRHKKYVWEEVFGKFAGPLLPAEPRSRVVYDRPRWIGHEVVLDVLPDVFAWGVLLIPKDLKPGERRPVVVCQHGRNGVPRDVIEGDQAAYHDFAARLADRGFVVFAPHNPYRGEDRYRMLSRKANGVKASLFSFILAQHEQILAWLGGLPFVDAQRIGFYGLSYGGETAVRVPPLLDGYALSICSADFNDWTRKVAGTHGAVSFMHTIEWEMPYFDMGLTYSYAELAALMMPRPFMVERGHTDGVAPDEWVAHEYAKVRRLYDQLGLGDRTEIEFFNGPHTINGQGTFAFLHRHLNWPAPP